MIRAGLDKCSRGASCHRLLLAGYLLGTQSSLNLSRAIPALIISLVTYMQVGRVVRPTSVELWIIVQRRRHANAPLVDLGCCMHFAHMHASLLRV